MACLVPILLDPAAALGQHPPFHMKRLCLGLVAVFLPGVSCAVCTRQLPSSSATPILLARAMLPAMSCTCLPLCVGALMAI